ncbi:MAG: hypothetical protein J3R72DRAFT_426863 [Linnemannia gamsii]|nr:MAG: hypothetical protein J3R72DRAFT_426863 [Linnemannia gamsii]
MSISELLDIPEEAIVGDNLDLMPSASDILAAHMEDENEKEGEDGNSNASEETPIFKQQDTDQRHDIAVISKMRDYIDNQDMLGLKRMTTILDVVFLILHRKTCIGIGIEFFCKERRLMSSDSDEDEDINEQQAAENDFEKEGNAFSNCIKLSPSLSEFNDSNPENEYEQGLAEAIVKATSSSSSTMTTVSSTTAAAATSMDAVKEPHGHRQKRVIIYGSWSLQPCSP